MCGRRAAFNVALPDKGLPCPATTPWSSPSITVLAHEARHDKQVENYGGGHIQARHGRITRWRLVVYLVMFAWALYYGYTYGGGLGPGLDLRL